MPDLKMNNGATTQTSHQASKRALPQSEERSQIDRSDTSKKMKADAQSPTQMAKPATLTLFKNKRFTLKQKTIEWSRSMSTLSTIIAFNSFLETCKQPLTDIPDEHLHMIAKLTQESDKSLFDAANKIKELVVPVADEDVDGDAVLTVQEILTTSSIVKAIEKVAERVNYAIDDAGATDSSVRSHLKHSPIHIWRWEIKDVGLLAADNREKILARREERVRAKAEIEQTFQEMPAHVRYDLLAPRSRLVDLMKNGVLCHTNTWRRDASKVGIRAPDATVQQRQQEKEAAIVIEDDEEDVKPTEDEFSTPSPKKKAVLAASPIENGDSKGSTSQLVGPAKERSEVKKAVALSPEQEAKQAEREEKKRQRELKRVEKEKKEADKEAKKKREAQANSKAASFMSSFIQRPRSVSPIKAEQKDASISDFDKAFQACLYKDVAPINSFRTGSPCALHVGRLAEENAVDLLQLFKAQVSTKRSHARRPRKGIHPPISVRESMRLITEASVLNDEKLEENGKRGLHNLSDRSKIPMKLLHFATDRRPAWYGTWTRTTNLVGPRRPLGQDPVALDYSYDSDAEWEDEDPNDGDDLMDNDEKEDEDGERSDDDSEMDDWLVDDLEEEEEEEAEAEEEEEGVGQAKATAPLLQDLEVYEIDAKGNVVAPTAVKTTTSKDPRTGGGGLINFLQPRKKKIKPIGRRFDAKLVPFSTGPHWQQHVGETSYDGFKGYQIDFLNDARPGLNPFTFVSSEHAFVAGPDLTGGLSVVKREAEVIAKACKAGPQPASTSSKLKAETFPNQHLPTLLQNIEGSTSIRPVLVEELKTKFASLGKTVTKANIDACINVYAEKLSKKMGARWVIKEEYRSTAGVQQAAAPTTTATIPTNSSTTTSTNTAITTSSTI
ncbi:hypothetical protein CBS101457_000414 [Exobasidium rhododendri]|nr:hypothetical protein CBS101457_000414 [Exobasidium rhododendri]